MKKDVAKRVLDVVFRQSGELDELVRVLRKEADNAEFLIYRQVVGEVLATFLTGIINPLVAEHEDLRPPGLNKV